MERGLDDDGVFVKAEGRSDRVSPPLVNNAKEKRLYRDAPASIKSRRGALVLGAAAEAILGCVEMIVAL